MATTARLKTYDDLLHTPDDGRRYELIDGEIYVSPSPRPAHQEVLGRLWRDIDTFVSAGCLGWAIFAPLDIELGPHDVVQPDIAFFAGASVTDFPDLPVRRIPDLVVEVLSPSTSDRDLGMKLELYARGGIPEYWIVDAVRRTFRGLMLVDGRYEEIPHDGRRFRSRVLPGFEVDLDALFAGLP